MNLLMIAVLVIILVVSAFVMKMVMEPSAAGVGVLGAESLAVSDDGNKSLFYSTETGSGSSSVGALAVIPPPTTPGPAPYSTTTTYLEVPPPIGTTPTGPNLTAYATPAPTYTEPIAGNFLGLNPLAGTGAGAAFLPDNTPPEDTTGTDTGTSENRMAEYNIMPPQPFYTREMNMNHGKNKPMPAPYSTNTSFVNPSGMPTLELNAHNKRPVYLNN